MATGGLASTNCYLIGDEATKQAIIFDAPDHTTAALLDEAQRLNLDIIGLWLTHGHFDHIAEHELVTHRFPNAKVRIHKLDEPKLKDPTAMMFDLPFTIPPRSADGYFEDGQMLSFGEVKVKVIHTPGHSPGHVMFHFEAEKLLVGGDLIICGGAGRTDFEDSEEAELFRSIRKVMELPDDTQLLPGHCDPSTLAVERMTNPYVQEALRR